MNNAMKQQLKKYIVGFILCVVLTLGAYTLTVNADIVSSNGLIIMAGLSILAVLQFVIQSIYFLHLNDEKGEKWHLSSFLSMLSVVLIVVIGSIWIMWNLNYNMMPSPQGTEAERYILEDEGIKHHEGMDHHEGMHH